MILAWQEYNRQIAEDNKRVAHGRPSTQDPAVLRNSFFRNNDFLEAATAIVSTIHSPFVVMGPVAGKPAGSPPAYKMTIKARIFFLAHANETVTNLEQVQDETFLVMEEWISRFLHDYETTGLCGPFARLDINRMFWQEVGPLAQREHGWQLDLEFQEKGAGFIYDPAQWYS